MRSDMGRHRRRRLTPGNVTSIQVQSLAGSSRVPLRSAGISSVSPLMNFASSKFSPTTPPLPSRIIRTLGTPAARGLALALAGGPLAHGELRGRGDHAVAAGGRDGAGTLPFGVVEVNHVHRLLDVQLPLLAGGRVDPLEVVDAVGRVAGRLDLRREHSGTKGVDGAAGQVVRLAVDGGQRDHQVFDGAVANRLLERLARRFVGQAL